MDVKRVCKDCGKELPSDSKFCQYCGSKNVAQYVEPKPISNVLLKKCEKCGKELPEDSVFCQYCGSKRIIIEKTEEESKERNSIKKNNLLIPLIIVSLLAASLGYGMYRNYLDYNKLEQETEALITKLNSDITRAKADSIALQKKALYLDRVADYAANSNAYNDFYARQTLLYKPYNKQVWIYFGHYNATVYFQASSNTVGAEWGNWSGQWVPLTITYKGNGVEYVKLTNSVNNEIIYITLVGD